MDYNRRTGWSALVATIILLMLFGCFWRPQVPSLSLAIEPQNFTHVCRCDVVGGTPEKSSYVATYYFLFQRPTSCEEARRLARHFLRVENGDQRYERGNPNPWARLKDHKNRTGYYHRLEHVQHRGSTVALPAFENTRAQPHKLCVAKKIADLGSKNSANAAELVLEVVGICSTDLFAD